MLAKPEAICFVIGQPLVDSCSSLGFCSLDFIYIVDCWLVAEVNLIQKEKPSSPKELTESSCIRVQIFLLEM